MANTNIDVYDIHSLELIDYNQMHKNLLSNTDMQEIEDMLRDDIEENIRKSRNINLVLRDLKIVRELKQQYGCNCQICGYTFQKDDGSYYCEAHHLVPVAEDGSQSPENVILLCANHHRLFHYAKDQITIGSIENGRRKIKIGNTEYNINCLSFG